LALSRDVMNRSPFASSAHDALVVRLVGLEQALLRLRGEIPAIEERTVSGRAGAGPGEERLSVAKHHEVATLRRRARDRTARIAVPIARGQIEEDERFPARLRWIDQHPPDPHAVTIEIRQQDATVLQRLHVHDALRQAYNLHRRAIVRRRQHHQAIAMRDFPAWISLVQCLEPEHASIAQRGRAVIARPLHNALHRHVLAQGDRRELLLHAPFPVHDEHVASKSVVRHRIAVWLHDSLDEEPLAVTKCRHARVHRGWRKNTTARGRNVDSRELACRVVLVERRVERAAQQVLERRLR
jgi:hypothetical protein